MHSKHYKLIQSIIEQQKNNKVKMALVNTINDTPLDMLHKTEIFDDDKYYYYHTFSPSDIKEPYEPFLSLIKEAYYKFFAETYSVEEFLNVCDVYPYVNNIFISYFETGYCEFDAIPTMIGGQREYNAKRFVSSISGILSYIANYKNICIVLQDLHYCGFSTITLLFDLINTYISSGNIIIIATFCDKVSISEHLSAFYNELINYCDKRELVFEITENYTQIPDFSQVKHYTADINRINDDLKKIKSLLDSFAFEQANHYIRALHKFISNLDEDDLSQITNQQKLKIYMYYTLCNIYSHNYKQAHLLIDTYRLTLPTVDYNSPELIKDRDLLLGLYYTNLLYCIIEYYQGNNELAIEDSRQCKNVARILADERLEFKASTLEDFHNLYSFTYISPPDKNSTYVKEMVRKSLKLGYIDAAIIYITLFYEIDEQTLRAIDRGESFSYFEKAVQYAISIDNIHLLQHMHNYKNMYAYNYQCYNTVKKCTILCNQYIKKYSDKFMEVGFNYALKEDYAHAFLIHNQNIISNYNKYIENKTKTKPIQDENLNIFYLSEICIIMLDIVKDSINNHCYEDAEKYILSCLTLMHNINKPLIFNATYGLLYSFGAYCSIKMNLVYKSYTYMNNATNYYSYRFETPDYAKMRDYGHLFQYYIAKGTINCYDEYYDEAAECFAKARKLYEDSPQLFLLDYEMLCIEEANLYNKQRMYEEERNVLTDCLDFYIKNKMPRKTQQLEMMLEHQHYDDYYTDYKLKGIFLDEILRASRDEYNDYINSEETKNSFFLSNWRKNINSFNRTIDSLNKNTMNTLKNVFDMSHALYVDTHGTTNIILYNDIKLDDEHCFIANLRDYFTANPYAVYLTRLENDFYKLSSLLKPLQLNTIDEIIIVPIFKNSKLCRICLMYSNILDILAINVYRSLFDKRLDIIEMALCYLYDAEENLLNKNKLKDYELLLSVVQEYISESVTEFKYIVRDGKEPTDTVDRINELIENGSGLLINRNEM
ncbi:MAG: hypothetical protein K6G26_06060 [Lachnospiraceae bacterium]|nr:hypothetical protein [Lachnospiraceae bacterium]